MPVCMRADIYEFLVSRQLHKRLDVGEFTLTTVCGTGVSLSLVVTILRSIYTPQNYIVLGYFDICSIGDRLNFWVKNSSYCAVQGCIYTPWYCNFSHPCEQDSSSSGKARYCRVLRYAWSCPEDYRNRSHHHGRVSRLETAYQYLAIHQVFD